MPTEEQAKKREAAKEVIDLLEEVAILLDTGLSRAQISLCVSLIENGVHPVALADVIKDLRRHADVGDAHSAQS